MNCEFSVIFKIQQQSHLYLFLASYSQFRVLTLKVASKIVDYRAASLTYMVFQNYIVHNIKIHKTKMKTVQPSDQQLHSPEHLEPMPLSISAKPIQERAAVQSKNKKWTDQQHARYILFLELNRQKIKSRLIRRSNQFYLEMAAFIKDKNGVQCRSHHQKYQARYKYPHRIIREEKAKLDKSAYNTVKSTYCIQPDPINSNHIVLAQPNSTLPKTPRVTINLKSISCQTEIQGLNQVFVKPEQFTDFSHWLHQYNNLPSANQGQIMMNWGMSYPFLYPANPYALRPF